MTDISGTDNGPGKPGREDGGPPSKRFKSSDDPDEEATLRRSSRIAARLDATFSDLRPELFGHISTFLSMRRMCRSDSDTHILSFLLCLGPEAASVVRQTYLKGNLYYLKYLRRCMQGTDYNISIGSSDVRYNNLRNKILCWMDYNEKLWKQISLGAACAKNVLTVTVRPNIHELKKIISKPDDVDVFYRSSLFYDHYPITLDAGNKEDEEDEEKNQSLMLLGAETRSEIINFAGVYGAVVTSIGGQLPNAYVRGTSTDQSHSVRYAGSCAAALEMVVRQAEENDGNVTITFTRSRDLVLNHPPTVIQLGLHIVLRHMVEENVVNPNAKYPCTGSDDFSYPLIFYAVRRYTRNLSCLRYLFSLLDANDLNALHRVGMTTEDTRYDVLHYAMWNGSLDALKVLLNYPDIVDVNKRNDYGYTALTALVEGAVEEDYDDDSPSIVDRVIALVEAGANPEEDDGRDALEIARGNLSFVARRSDLDSDYEEEVDDWRKTVAILEAAADDDDRSIVSKVEL